LAIDDKIDDALQYLWHSWDVFFLAGPPLERLATR